MTLHRFPISPITLFFLFLRVAGFLLLTQVWKEKQHAFRALVRTVLLDQSSVDDVLQEAFARVLQSQKRFSGQQEAYYYLRKTVLSTTIDSYRRIKRYTHHVATAAPSPSSGYSPFQQPADPLSLLIREEETAEQRHLVEQVRAALAELPPRQKEAIELFFGRAKRTKLKDVCREAGIPYSTLRSRMIRGIDKIRLRLKEQEVAEFAGGGD
jgi:RNA polymerase sigma factor (sigma-70 family)